MKVTWEKFQSAYMEADEDTKKIIDQNIAIPCVDNLALQYPISSDLRKEFILLYTYMILGLIKESELMNFIGTKIKPEAGADQVFSSLLLCVTRNSKPLDIVDPNTARPEPDKIPQLRTMQEDLRWESESDTA